MQEHLYEALRAFLALSASSCMDSYENGQERADYTGKRC